MSLRSIAPLLLGAAAALLPCATPAQQTAQEALQSIASRAHFRIRLAELCRQPDDTRRQEMSSKILGWVSAEAARVGIPDAALADAAADGIAQADSRFGRTPSADECASGTRDFTAFLANTISQRKSAQSVLLARHARAHFQMRMAQRCGQPDEARQKEIATRLNESLTAHAAEAGVLPMSLTQNAADAASAADAAYARDSSAKRCQQEAESLITLSGG